MYKRQLHPNTPEGTKKRILRKIKKAQFFGQQTYITKTFVLNPHQCYQKNWLCLEGVEVWFNDVYVDLRFGFCGANPFVKLNYNNQEYDVNCDLKSIIRILKACKGLMAKCIRDVIAQQPKISWRPSKAFVEIVKRVSCKEVEFYDIYYLDCLLYTSPSPRD